MHEKLTRRQAQFVAHLIDLNRDLDGPIHYSVLAEDLGVSPFTAYDMLRLLEEKGLVTSVYQMPEDKNGPGRSERVFYATEQGRAARRRARALAATAVPAPHDLPANPTAALCHGEPLAAALAADLLTRLHAQPAAARFALELLPLVALRLRRGAAAADFRALITAVLPPDQPADPAGLALLGGALLGFLGGAGQADEAWLADLAAHARPYQAYVLGLDGDAARRLGADFQAALQMMWAVLDAAGAETKRDGAPGTAVPQKD